ncbi:MAG: hypothetical protein M3Z57_09615 [Candidatus Dormibacteraeota bacterium]|nr:hypothetical protein [Candidatus Dormibacteraeota bacterium]
MGPIQISLGGSTGPVLATVPAANASGSFSVVVTIPNVAPGDTFIAANGSTRQAVTVLASRAPVVPPPAPVVTPPPAVAPPVPAAVTPILAAATPSPRAKVNLKAAIASCNRKYNARKAKTRRRKHLMAHRRTACIARAHAAAKADFVTTHSLDFSFISETSRRSLVATLFRGER